MTKCIPATGSPNGRGYGQKRVKGKRWLAHRLAWTLANGPIPDGMLVCHKCDNPICVNVEHLFLGTHTDNMRDMTAKGRNGMTKKTHCRQGHEYTEENTWRDHKRNARHCKTCHKETERKRRANVHTL